MRQAPIVGDPIYGQRADHWAHAQQLHFIHPACQQTIELESPAILNNAPMLDAVYKGRLEGLNCIYLCENRRGGK